MENYDIIQHLGNGVFGKILKISRKSDSKILLCKEVFYGDLSEKEKKQVVNEVNIIRELKHPNITKYHDRIVDKQSCMIYMITEYCEGGNLLQLLKQSKRDKSYLPEDTVWKYFMQIVLALHECHRNKVIHRDIKPSNIFMDSYKNPKIGDFGFAKVIDQQNHQLAATDYGNSYYLVPEQLEEDRYNEKSDVWACGCLLYEMCALNPPFVASNPLSLALKVKSAKFERIPSKYSDELQRVIVWILNRNWQERPSVDDLLNIPEISMRLRDKRLRDSKNTLKKREEDLKKKTESLEGLEKNLKIKESALKQKEDMLLEQEKRIKDMEEKSSRLNLKIVRNSVGDDVLRSGISPKYAGQKRFNAIYMSTDPSSGRAGAQDYKYANFGEELDATIVSNFYNTQDIAGLARNPSSEDGYFNKEVKQILKSLDNIMINSNINRDKWRNTVGTDLGEENYDPLH